MKRTMRLLGWMGVGLLCAVSSGCISRLASYDVVVHVDESMGDEQGNLPSIEVHMLGLNQSEANMMERRSMTEYWNPNRRQDSWDRAVMQFGARKEPRQVLGHEDPIWARWSRGGAESLVVLADLPGLFQDRDSVEDPRRQSIALKRTRLWVKPRRTIDIRIDRNGVYYQPFAHQSLLTPRDEDLLRRAYEAK
jgi:hypothetical protein